MDHNTLRRHLSLRGMLRRQPCRAPAREPQARMWDLGSLSGHVRTRHRPSISECDNRCWPRMDHYFPDVPGLGNVAVSRHAQARLVEDGISEHDFKEALFNGTTIPDGQDVLWREKDGVRVVILRQPTPFKGAMLAKTVYRVRPAARATK